MNACAQSEERFIAFVDNLSIGKLVEACRLNNIIFGRIQHSLHSTFSNWMLDCYVFSNKNVYVLRCFSCSFGLHLQSSHSRLHWFEYVIIIFRSASRSAHCARQYSNNSFHLLIFSLQSRLNNERHVRMITHILMSGYVTFSCKCETRTKQRKK